VKTPIEFPASCRRGFTLLELLVVVVVVGVLAALASAGYRQVINRAHRVDARTALLRVQYQQERHYAQFNRYATDLLAPAASGGLGLSSRSDTGDYDLALEAMDDAQGYTVTAHASGQQTDDRGCQWMSIDATGRRRSANGAGVWTEDDVNRCWG
jgi:type IV pilus assembly protein PilE